MLKMEFKIHHIAISISKLDETITFYKEIFGFNEYCKYQDNNTEIWLLELDGIKLEVFYLKSNKNKKYKDELKTDWSKLGVKHFGLTTNNLDECRRKLIDKGVNIITEIKDGRNPVEYFFIKDPNGILIEVIKEK